MILESNEVKWFATTLAPTVTLNFKIDKILEQYNSPYQEILLFENSFYGKVLSLDGFIQLTEKDKKYYHEVMASKPFYFHSEIKNVLIIGGGDLFLAKELLKRKVEKITIVDLDCKVSEVVLKHFKELSDVISDARIRLLFENGIDYVNDVNETFDLIFIDSTDPFDNGPATKLYEFPFYYKCHSILSRKGMLITQNGIPFFSSNSLNKGMISLKPIFQYIKPFKTVIPSFGGVEFVFLLSTNYPFNLIDSEIE